MRYKGYAVTYVGEKFFDNKENFFLNGICREEYDAPNSCVRNKNFKSRNIYALSAADKSDEAEGPLSYIAMDVLKSYHGGDFDKEYQDYFHTANTAITSHVLDKKDSYFEVDISVLSINHDVATVYNMGDIPVLYYEAGSREMVNLSGKAPEFVEVEKNYLNKKNEVQTDILTKQNLSRIGILNSDCEIVPYKSVSKKLRKKTYFVMCSKAVLESLGETKIREILDDNNIKKKDKAIHIMSKAVENNPDGKYTVQVVVATPGLSVPEAELKSLGNWAVIAALCMVLCINGDYIVDGIYKAIDACKSFVQSFTGDDEQKPVDDLRWTPKENSDDKQDENSEGGTVTEENESSETQTESQETVQEESVSQEPTPAPAPTPTPAPAQSSGTSAPRPSGQQTPSVENSEPSAPVESEPSTEPEPSVQPEQPQVSPPEDPEIPTQGDFELPVV